MRHDRLPETGFLSAASAPLREMLESQATEVRLSNGEVLFEQGDTGDAFYAIVEGALEFSILSASGRKLSLDLMRAGAVFGEIVLFDPGPRTARLPQLSPAGCDACAIATFWPRSSNSQSSREICCASPDNGCGG
jgi:CRP/FNR family cyclic AMP-dependent transcriptional regulator